jgi:8-amino-7-oxononanoate synthase
MGLLQDKLAKYDLPQQYMAMGVYPYFRTIDSHQDTEVLMDGKKVLMFGSNAYTGLTYDKRIIEASDLLNVPIIRSISSVTPK